MGVSKILRAGLGRSEDTPNKTSEVSICVTNSETGLPTQARIHYLVLFRSPVELGQDHRRHNDVASKPPSSLKCRPSLGEALTFLARQAR